MIVFDWIFNTSSPNNNKISNSGYNEKFQAKKLIWESNIFGMHLTMYKNLIRVPMSCWAALVASYHHNNSLHVCIVDSSTQLEALLVGFNHIQTWPKCQWCKKTSKKNYDKIPHICTLRRESFLKSYMLIVAAHGWSIMFAVGLAKILSIKSYFS